MAGRSSSTSAGGDACLDPSARRLPDFAFEDRPVVLKIHGAVDRDDRERQLRHHRGPLHRLPRAGDSRSSSRRTCARIRLSDFLFLGYGMRDWNLRVSSSATSGRSATAGRVGDPARAGRDRPPFW